MRNSPANPERATPTIQQSCLGYVQRFTVLLLLQFSMQVVASEEPQADCSAPEKDSNELLEDNHAPQSNNRLVIIIDDLGHSLSRDREALKLPGKINFAVIPYTQYGATLAESAHQKGKEVLLHAPMSTLDAVPLGEGGLTAELSREEFRSTLTGALEQVPHVQGINNHMGSSLTQERLQMSWLMQELRMRDLYFVDSRTSQKTVAATVAGEFNVPHLSRHVFLDNERSEEAIDARFQELLQLAQRDGIAVAIGHPYPETTSYLKNALLTVHERGFRPVFISEALHEHVTPRENAAQAGAEEKPSQNTPGGC